jgi:tripartite-type tricarboxylate transporter receptor subunit TctC
MRRIGFFAALAAALLAAPALAQSRLTIVVPFAPGGGIDIFARLMGEEIGKAGQNTLIENRPGASSMIGSVYVARAAPDGGTVLLTSNSTLIAPTLRPSDFDPRRDLTPVCNLAESAQVIVVGANAPHKTLADLVAAAKARPGALTIGSNGPASTQHFGAEMFKHAAGVDMVYVPYNGGAPAVTALVGGQIDAIVANVTEVHSQIAAGQLRALATSSSKRIATYPDLPTTRESGLDFDVASWHGVALPAKAPADVVARVENIFMSALAAPALRDKLANAKYAPTGVCGAPVREFMDSQVESIARIAKESGIRMD